MTRVILFEAENDEDMSDIIDNWAIEGHKDIVSISIRDTGHKSYHKPIKAYVVYR